ncbi:Hypothetical predicted protein [Paramuricea clavata]|uniref:Uncharacterized protein n=1 Tax=Paramuricea clavata TaxID=317549 RepID=A0A6S7JIF2_PARCT|nr:Hypothetical predicted protein [Paramuricea clavata]
MPLLDTDRDKRRFPQRDFKVSKSDIKTIEVFIKDYLILQYKGKTNKIKKPPLTTVEKSVFYEQVSTKL